MIHKSVFTNEQDLLKALLEIHNDGKHISLDPMYFKGNFYKNGLGIPTYIYDVSPQVNYCPVGRADNLFNHENNSIDSMILDPPFMFGIHGKSANYYSSKTHGIFKDFQELEELYKSILKEAYRVLKKKGLLIFKCQDYTDSKTTMTHCLVWQWAREQGFYAKDLAILSIERGKVANSKLTQRHLRKIHSYFWVFIKG